MAARFFVFDAYGTLFDVHAAIGRHRAAVGPDADRLSELWRTKQLEYSWTLTLAGRYEPFWTLTERALDFVLARFPAVDRALKPKLMDAYRRLDAYADEATVPSFGPRMVCTSCGIIGADARPNWRDQPERPSLTGTQWRN